MASRHHLDFQLEAATEDGLFKRSRTGCLTCRKRKKKCDEQFDASQSCKRCKGGGWKCIRPEGNGRSPSSRERRSASTMSLERAASTSAAQEPTASTSTSNSPILPTSSPALFPPTFPVPTSLYPSSALPYPLFSTSTGTLAHDPTFDPLISYPSSTLPFLSPSAPFDPSSLPYTPPDLPLPPHPYTPAQEPLPPTTTSLNPSDGPLLALLDSLSSDAELGAYLAHLPEDEEALLARFELSLQGASAGTGFLEIPTGGDGVFPVNESATSLAGEGFEACRIATTAPSRRTPQEINAVLDHFYRDYLVAAWTVTYPSITRAVTTRKHLELTAKFAITRLTSRVAAAAYIKLYKSDASRLPYAAPEPASLPEQYRDIDVDPLALLAEATRLLATPQDDGVTLESQLMSLSNLHLALGALHFPSRSSEIVDTSVALFRHAFGGPVPHLNSNQLHEFSSIAVHALAMVDFARSLAQRRPMFLRLVVPPEREGGMGGTGGEGDTHENWFGLPFSLAVPLAEATNLCAAAQPFRQYPCAPLPLDLELKALELVTKLGAWRPRVSVYGGGGEDQHPVSMASEITVATEAWRYTGLILLHFTVLRRSPSSFPPLQNALTNLVSSLRAVDALAQARRKTQPLLLDWCIGNSATCAFLGGALVTDKEDRGFCRRLVASGGREPSLGAMNAIMEATWKRTDETGVLADWFDVGREEGIAFVFY
ncbi:hypothetical protein JCM8547_005141 [Rhodosporidiobolus lusitaniae]